MSRFSIEHDWFTAIAALVVWTAHFMLSWTASSAFPGEPAARWIAAALTVLAALALAWLWLRAGRPSLFSVAGLGCGLAAAAVAFGFVPALIG